VVESLLDSVYQREVTCLIEYEKARAVIDLAEKWDFHHVVKLVEFHFSIDKTDKSSLRVKRLTLAMALNAKEVASEYIKQWHAGTWDTSPTSDIGKPKPFPTFGDLYLQDCSVAELLEVANIRGADVFDLGSWGYESHLQLSPTTTWAIMRARHLATTVPSEVDGAKFQDEFAKLLDIIMPVSTSFSDRGCR